MFQMLNNGMFSFLLFLFTLWFNEVRIISFFFFQFHNNEISTLQRVKYFILSSPIFPIFTLLFEQSSPRRAHKIIVGRQSRDFKRTMANENRIPVLIRNGKIATRVDTWTFFTNYTGRFADAAKQQRLKIINGHSLSFDTDL